MGIDYEVCKVCREAFPDVVDYGWCGTCEDSICERCNKKMIEKYGQVNEDSKFAQNYGEYNPVTCDRCENPSVTISKEEYERLLNDSEFLNCLKACGVDNWQGWDDAMQMFSEEEE